MGASGWEYRVPFTGSVEATLAATQERVLASGDYLWPWEDYPGDPDAEVRRPATLAELAAAKQEEEFWDEGTHSILDIERVRADGDADDFGTIQPLVPAELREVFGTERPTLADFQRGRARLDDLPGEPWTGRAVTIHEHGAPTQAFFFGCSGD
ncbi:MAG: hypothetical protein FWD74_01385 [Actinomycetia bacterium]|nr:hypothetical protein [Actinomycetes bacterium]